MPNIDEIDYLLQHLTSLLARNSDQILLEQLGLGYAQFKILRVLNPGLAVKQRTIAAALGQTEASISRQIKLLVVKGYITRSTEPHNKRVRLIKITPKGQEIAKVSEEALSKYHSSLLSEFSDKQKANLLSSLENFHSHVCKVAHNPATDYINFITDNQ